MAVATTANKVQFTGDGATVAFAFTFPVTGSGDLVVKEDQTTKTITTHYTVAASANDYANGGTVTFLTAPANGTAVTIERSLDYTSSLDLSPGDTIPAEDLEDAIDRLTMQMQQLKDNVDRCIQFPATDPSGTLDVVLTDVANRTSGLTIVFDGDGNPTVGSELTGTTATAFWATVLDDADGLTSMRTLMDDMSQVLRLDQAVNADERIRFASDASILWDESADEFVFDKTLRSSAFELYDGSTDADRNVGFASDADILWDESEDYFDINKNVRMTGLQLKQAADADRNIEFASDADVLWDESEDRFDINKDLYLSGNKTFKGQFAYWPYTNGATVTEDTVHDAFVAGGFTANLTWPAWGVAKLAQATGSSSVNDIVHFTTVGYNGATTFTFSFYNVTAGVLDSITAINGVSDNLFHLVRLIMMGQE